MINDCDTYALYETKMRRANKHRVCDECSRQIERGETYRYAKGLYDGRWEHHAMCAHCSAAAEWLLSVCNGYQHCGVREDLVEHWTYSETYRSVWLARAIAGMRRRWCRRDGTLLPVPGPPPITATGAPASNLVGK